MNARDAPLFWWRDVDHGEFCDCMLLAKAVGAEPMSVDFAYCHNVLQKHWRLRCNHGGRAAMPRLTPTLPRLDAHDAVQAILLVNVPGG